jgi:hypothetical protein
MKTLAAQSLPKDFASELERKFFWWTPAGSQPRSETRILAQAMSLASFEDVRRLETVVGPHRLADVMLEAEPGWITDRSWEFWRGRLQLATSKVIPEGPPRRSFDAGAL